MAKIVVDASVIIAALLPDEPYNQPARTILQSASPLVTSSLMRLLVQDVPCAEVLKLTESLNRPATYDTSYLALAQAERVPLVTADRRLYNALKGRFKWVRWIEQT